MPDAPGLELIAQEVNTRHEGAVLGTSFEHAQATLLVGGDSIVEVLTYLKEAPGQEYDILSSLHGVAVSYTHLTLPTNREV